MPRIYLSYAPDDADFASRLTRELERTGVVVESSSTLPPEDEPSFGERVEAAIRASDAVVILFSQATRASTWMQQEIDLSQRLRSRGFGGVIIPVILEPLRLPESLADAQTISTMGRSPEDVARVIRELLETDARSEMWGRVDAQQLAPELDEIVVGAAEEAEPEPTPPLPQAPPAPGAPPILDEPLAAAPTTGALPRLTGPVSDIISDIISPIEFRAYHANTLAVETWNTLLVYTATGEVAHAVAADAATFTELGSAPRTSSGQSSRAVAHGAELTVEPHMAGVTFSPDSETFIWRGGWHRSLFRFQAGVALAGTELAGWVDVYSGPMVPIARIDLAFAFTASRPALALRRPAGRTVTSNPHDTVFISYSHRDREAFSQACDEYARFGIQVYTDEHLEAGADYESALGRMIASARVFHLLWSPTSANSMECRKEWTAALLREPSERFIKPWFWRHPLTPPPPDFVQHHISFRFQRLRRRLLNPGTWF